MLLKMFVLQGSLLITYFFIKGPDNIYFREFERYLEEVKAKNTPFKLPRDHLLGWFLPPTPRVCNCYFAWYGSYIDFNKGKEFDSIVTLDITDYPVISRRQVKIFYYIKIGILKLLL